MVRNMMSELVHYGGSLSEDITGDYTVLRGLSRLLVLDPTDTDGHAAILPDATELRLGGPQFIVINENASWNLLIKDNGSNTLVTMSAKECAICSLVDNSTANGSWIIQVKALIGEVSA